MLFRLLALELDDEMPGIFSRPWRSGTLKFLCLSLLDAPNLEVALHRLCQFFHLLVEDFKLNSRRAGGLGYLELYAGPEGPGVSMLGRELMLKFVHGVASWLIRQKIELVAVDFESPRPAQASDHLYLFPGPVRFNCDATRLCFDSAYLDMPIRQNKTDLSVFLRLAPEGCLFESFAEQQMVCHRVRQCIADRLPAPSTIEEIADYLHYSARTLCRRLQAEGTSFQAVKDEVRRDIAIQRLTRSDDTITAIAFDVGFDNPTAFHRAFRHWTGSTPTVYRSTAGTVSQPEVSGSMRRQ